MHNSKFLSVRFRYLVYWGGGGKGEYNALLLVS